MNEVRGRFAFHLDDDEVVEPTSARAREHLAACRRCRDRVSDAAAVRAYVANAGDDEIAPPNDIAAHALRAIRSRSGASAGVNEAVASFGGAARSFLHFIFGRRT